MKELGITPDILSYKAGIEITYLQKIIYIKNDTKRNVNKILIDQILSTLGVSPSYIYGQNIPKHYQEGNYLLEQIKKWTQELFKQIPDDKKDSDNLAAYNNNVSKDKIFSNILVFGKTPIMKYISNSYSSVKQFIEENASFSIIPIHGYCRNENFLDFNPEIKNKWKNCFRGKCFFSKNICLEICNASLIITNIFRKMFSSKVNK